MHFFKTDILSIQMNYDLTIIVPVFNEEDNLERVYSELSNFISNTRRGIKVLFINDGSRDGSLEKIREICDRSPLYTYCSFDRNYGLSAAIKAGFSLVNTPLVGYIDADLQTSPQDFEHLLKYADNYDLVTGVRTDRKDSFVKNISSRIANRTRRAFTHDGMDDTGCPLKIIKTRVAKRIPMFKGFHYFLPAMVLLQKGKVVQIPVQHFPRKAGESKFNLWNRLFGPLIDCIVFLWMKKKYINYTIEELKVR